MWYVCAPNNMRFLHKEINELIKKNSEIDFKIQI